MQSSNIEIQLAFRERERERGLTETNDGVKVGETGVADALGDGEAGDGDAGEKVGLKLGEGVLGCPLQYGNEVLHQAACGGAPRLVLQMPKWIVRQERLLEVGPE